MNATVSSFFSRDTFLKRNRTPKAATMPTLNSCPSSPLKPTPLHIIVEDDARLASRSPSPMEYSPSTSLGGNFTLGVKAKRRHANLIVSDIKLAPVVDAANGVLHGDRLLSAPRPAPRPPTTPSPEQSPDSFNLTFTDTAYNFPYPPLSTPSLSPFDRFGAMSPTPSLSLSPSSSPRSQSHGLPKTPCGSDDDLSSPRPFNPRRASIKPLRIAKHKVSIYPVQDNTLLSSSPRQPFNNEPEISLPPSPITPTSSWEASSSESDSDSESDSEWYSRELSKILTLSSQLPSTFQKVRPESIPVPLPHTPTFSSNLPVSPTSAAKPTSPPGGFPSAQLDPEFPRRRRSHSRAIPKHPPPPVPRLPAHISSVSMTSPKPNFEVKVITPRRPPPRSSIPADCAFEDDNCSVSSFSLYEDASETVYSPTNERERQGSANTIDLPVEFSLDVDLPMVLPLPLAEARIGLEVDIANGLEELRLHRTAESPVLRSRWSSSTLSTVREEHRGKGKGAPPSKLRLYFGGGSPGSGKVPKRGSVSKKVPQTPTSPWMSPFPSPSPSKRFRHSRKGSAEAVSGAERRPSATGSVSDDESEEGVASGLRRKPIPVEMFLRN